MSSETKTTGTVAAVKKVRWIKIKMKAVRLHPLDGVIFPHIITVRYSVDDSEFSKKKFIRARFAPPRVGETVEVFYRAEDPLKCRIVFDERRQTI